MSLMTTKTEQTIAALKWVPTSTNALPSAPGRFGEAVWFSGNYLANVQVFPVEWQDEEFRRAVLESEVAEGIAWQIRVNREERGLTQSVLAQKMGTKQSAISKLENADGGDVRVKTLIKVAHAFDCALLVKFVSYSDFALETADVCPERLLACGFAEERISEIRNHLKPLGMINSSLILFDQKKDSVGDSNE